MTLGERIVLLKDGRIEQAAPPMEVYRRPATMFAATFLGSPPMNLLPARLGTDGAARVDGLDLLVPLTSLTSLSPGDTVTLGVRPEDVLIDESTGPEPTWTVAVVEPTGSHMHVHMTASGRRLIATVAADRRVSPGHVVRARFRERRVHVFAADATVIASGC